MNHELHELATIESNTLQLPMQHVNETLCQYQSKSCDIPRAVKQNGELHKLCEFHRQKANMNQKRMQQRRRLMKKDGYYRPKATVTTGLSELPTDDLLIDDDGNILEVATDVYGKFTDEDWKVLEPVLFGERAPM